MELQTSLVPAGANLTLMRRTCFGQSLRISRNILVLARVHTSLPDQALCRLNLSV